MLRTRIFAFGLALFAAVAVQAKGIEFFKGTYQEALAEAKKQKKPIFMDCYAEWCGPCKVLASKVFTQEKVGEFFNTHFINMKVDMEKGEGRELARKFQVSAYPTLVFLNPDGATVHKITGFREADPLIEEANKALETYKVLPGMVEQFRKGKKDREFVASVLAKTSDVDAQLRKELLEAFYKGAKDDDLLKPEFYTVYARYVNDLNHRHTHHILQNKQRYMDAYGNEPFQVVYQKLVDRVNNAGNEGETAFLASLDEVATLPDTALNLIAVKALMNYYLRKGGPPQPGDKMLAFMEKHAYQRPHLFVQMVSDLGSAGNVDNLFSRSASFGEKLGQRNTSYYSLLGQAMAWYLAGDMAKAETAVNKALEIGKKEGHDTSPAVAVQGDIQKKKN